MSRKKLVNILILVAAIIFVIAGAVSLLEEPITASRKGIRLGEKNKKIAKLSEQYQKYLDETAGKITGSPVNPHIISQIRSEIFKKMPNTKLYLWMSNTTGEFVFGIPSPVFTRLNKTFDKYRSIIEKDGYYVDRNDFLLNLVDKHNNIRVSQFDEGGRRRFEGADWRFYKEHFFPGKSSRSIRLALSSAIMNEDKQVIGDLYLKIYEPAPRSLFFKDFGSYTSTVFEVFHVIFGFAAVLLWFLVPTWIYIDAQQRDVKNVNLWILLTIVSFGFAFLIYLITRPPALKSFHCPECEKELNGTKGFCPYCGFDLSSTFCPGCQYPVKPGWQFCPNCRFDLTKKPGKEVPDEGNVKNSKEK